MEEARQSDKEVDGDVGSQGSHSPGPERNGIHSLQRRHDSAAYEQAGEGEDYAQAM